MKTIKTKKLRITKNMDLIKMHKDGLLDQLEDWLNERSDNNVKFVNNLRHFHHYFWELEEVEVKSGYSPNLEIRRDLDRTKIYEDPLFPEFKRYAERYLGAKNKYLELGKGVPSELVPDEIGKDFYNKYMCRKLKGYGFATSMQDALIYGNDQIIRILKNHAPKTIKFVVKREDEGLVS